MGEGTTFHVYLPLTTEQAARAVEVETSQRPIATGQRVLYVDDDEVILLMIQGFCNAMAWRLLHFRTRRTRWRRSRPDLIRLMWW